MMGYLSCKADSAIAIISTTPASPASSLSSSSTSRTKQEKTIKIQQFNYSDIEAATDGFSDQNLLGKGSHGCVYKAVLRGRHVAVKKPSKGLEIGQEVDNEIEILSKIHSPRLVNLLGFANDTKDRLLVVEFMSNGTLYDILHSNSRPPNWGRRIRMALQIAKAVDTLHSQNPPGKLGAIYDPRTVPLKDPMIRKQLALIASKCVRSCRERRPAMKEVVHWLTALSKLVPLHSWNGFNNPCMMVDTMGCPAELRNIQSGSRPQGDGEEILEGIYGKMEGDRERVFRFGVSKQFDGTHGRDRFRSVNRVFSSRFVGAR
ncbi:hypothetical protein SADUNF_Sadunf16G0148000 [Salix dunnii]|uniref:Protein kinase domain-containing protein n=1 Tax=Salix dunnii TaxID=1413687 RepID=A0A835MLU4_9ROSI|nr:hypothetical protein SADUNF_Sadunf16G0148000 [Salix dunnii]